MTTAILPKPITTPVAKLSMDAEVFHSVAAASAGKASILEPKYDGWRLLVHVTETGTEFYTRSGGAKHQHLVPQGIEIANAFPAGTWLDAEAVSFYADDEGNLHHGWGSVQSILGGNPKPLAEQEKITLVVFDLMSHGGIDARPEPFRNRRSLLRMVFESTTFERVILTPQFEATEDNHGANLAMGFEGSMVKWLDAPYRSGVRGHGQGKLKPQETADAIVIGFKPGEGSWTGLVGALIVGMKDEAGELVEATRFSGFDYATRVHISENPDEYLGRVVEFKHHGVMPSGGFRHPQFSRFRDEEKTEADSLPSAAPVAVEPVVQTAPKPAPPVESTTLHGTGRSGSGKLRNFKAMNDAKFAGVLADVLAEGDDPEAIAAVQAEAARRNG